MYKLLLIEVAKYIKTLSFTSEEKRSHHNFKSPIENSPRLHYPKFNEIPLVNSEYGTCFAKKNGHMHNSRRLTDKWKNTPAPVSEHSH